MKPAHPSKPSLITLQSVQREKRRQDKNLARYFAYRLAVWKDQHPETPWATLASLLGVARPVITQLANGENGSHARVAMFARALGPDTEDEFKQLATKWAEENPSWIPGQKLPERITHTGDPLVDGQVGGRPVFSDSLREAARAIVGLMKCTPDQARAAAEVAHASLPEGTEGDWLFWLQQLKPHVEALQRGSGQRPSARTKAAPAVS